MSRRKSTVSLPPIALLEHTFRECDFQLVTGNEAYLDFVKDNSSLRLVRISFDGFGCCSCNGIAPMDFEDAQELIAMVESKSIDQGACRRIVVKYCQQHTNVIWEDALKRHGLDRFE